MGGFKDFLLESKAKEFIVKGAMGKGKFDDEYDFVDTFEETYENEIEEYLNKDIFFSNGQEYEVEERGKDFVITISDHPEILIKWFSEIFSKKGLKLEPSDGKDDRNPDEVVADIAKSLGIRFRKVKDIQYHFTKAKGVIYTDSDAAEISFSARGKGWKPSKWDLSNDEFKEVFEKSSAIKDK